MTQLIVHHGRPAAIVGATEVFLAPHIGGLPFDHPVRQVVVAKALFALEVADGLAPGPYTDEAAERWARRLLRETCIAGRRRSPHRWEGTL
jgi:hypothetical protein